MSDIEIQPSIETFDDKKKLIAIEVREAVPQRSGSTLSKEGLIKWLREEIKELFEVQGSASKSIDASLLLRATIELHTLEEVLVRLTGETVDRPEDFAPYENHVIITPVKEMTYDVVIPHATKEDAMETQRTLQGVAAWYEDDKAGEEE